MRTTKHSGSLPLPGPTNSCWAFPVSFARGRVFLFSRKWVSVSFSELVEGVLAEGNDAFDGVYTKLMDLSVSSMAEEKPRLAIAYARLAKVFRDFRIGRSEAIREIVKEMDSD